MKKQLIFRLCALALFLSLVIAPLAAENYQKVFPIDAEEYDAVCYLYTIQGLSLPSSSGPWSAAELTNMLDKIDRSDLSDGLKAVYDFVDESINEVKDHRMSDSLAMSYDNTLSVEGYYHTNTDSYIDEDLWRMDYEARNGLYKGEFETWAADMFYGDFDLELKINPFRETNDTSDMFGDSAITTNILMVPPSVLNDLNMNIPYRAFGSVGGENWNLQFGRDNLSWGSGETGNLMLGGQLNYQDFIKFATFHDNFKFTQVYSFFPHPGNYYFTSTNNNGTTGDTSDDYLNVLSPIGQERPLQGIRMFIAHRLEFRMFDDLLNFAIAESMMYMSDDNTWNLGLLNPFMLYHDNYIRANSNSMLSMELEAAPIDNWSLYGQMVVDEFALPGEPTSGAGTHPEAFGFLGGIKTAYPMGDGVLYGVLEGAKTDPYLYLRGDGTGGDQNIGEIGINYVVGVRSFSPDGNISIDEDFLGYEYGCDAIVLNLTGGYKVFKKFYVEGTFFYMLHGVNDMYTLWAIGTNDSTDPSAAETPTDSVDTGSMFDDTPGYVPKDAVETTLLLELKGGYNILPNLEVYGQLDWVSKQNFGNVETNGTKTDTQVSIGTTFSF